MSVGNAGDVAMQSTVRARAVGSFLPARASVC